jgi:hypothetical protein
MSTVKRLTFADYTVGWICALPKELAASELMLDECHSLLSTPSGDPNCYSLGRVGNHNVVMACLPAGQVGTSSAATVAIHMHRTFRSIRFGLMVGVGGGAPSAQHDIRLGDVVVGIPNGRNGGIIQYDFGKTVYGGEFEQSGSLNAAPPVLLSALAQLQARHVNNPQSFARYVSAIPPNILQKYAYLGADKDKLFRTQYEHVAESQNCGEIRMRRQRVGGKTSSIKSVRSLWHDCVWQSGHKTRNNEGTVETEI